MKNAKKAMLLVLCAVLLVAGSVMGTMAYLKSQTEAVVNTFTVGKVEITLDEAKVDVYGVKDTSEPRVTANTYKLIPGHTYVKDPVVHVSSDSENCYVFVKVENSIAAIEADTKIADQMTANGWILVDDETDVYYYNEVCGAGYNLPTFTQFTVKGTETDLTAYAGQTVNVYAYAVQADGFASANAAWDATFGD